MRKLLRRWRRRSSPPPVWPRWPVDVERFALRLPKVDLHVPLESSLRPATVLSLAQGAGLDLGVESEAELRGRLIPRSPENWRSLRRRWQRLLSTANAIEVALRDLMAEMRMQTILHAEVIVPWAALAEEEVGAEQLRALLEGLRHEATEQGARLTFLLGVEDTAFRGMGDLVGLAWGGFVFEGTRAPETCRWFEEQTGRPSGTRIGVDSAVDPEGLDADRLVHVRAEASETTSTIVECPAVDRLLGLGSLGRGPVATAGGPLLGTNLTREMLRSIAGAEDPRAALVERSRAGILAASLEDAGRSEMLERLETFTASSV